MKHAIRYHACRLFGHAWDAIPTDWIPHKGIGLTLRCARCAMERRDSVERSTGIVLARAYLRPKDYMYSKVEDRPTRPEFRSAWIEQHIRQARAARRRGE